MTLRSLAFVLFPLVVIACVGREDHAQSSTSSRVEACPLDDPSACVDSIDSDASDPSLAACFADDQCGAQLLPDDDDSASTALARPTLHAKSTETPGWSMEWRGQAEGWSAVGSTIAEAAFHHYLAKLQRQCSALATADQNNQRRCVLLKFERQSGGFWPYRTYSQKVRCECNANVNAVHPDEG
jgi:hypothetical protein